ncbi:DUF1697 domain-containing protein [Leifsonia aquatica]|uniref:DUF1697 domain-containing protein n=1 Tax=Leifsonia aquatica TaxID=144185 RepID=UPI000469AEF9|nr:DUF1697 domain-containing protein [Leifsonia aquatica]
MLAVGLVRGINVGASTRVAAGDLAAAFQDAGLRDVVTLLQSGNAVFVADEEPTASLAARVEEALRARSGVSARVVLLPEERFRAVAAANPLVAVADDDARLVVTFLDHELPEGVELPADAETVPELIRAGERALYQWCPLGVSKSVVPAAFWRAVGPVAAARNQRTVARLLAELDRRG